MRGRPFNKALLWSDGNAFGSRAYFVTGKRPAAALQVEAVELKDAGVYRCRVDFRNSPTRNFQVNLSVIGKFIGCIFFIFSVINHVTSLKCDNFFNFLIILINN